jgi:hypothetical protein
VKSLPPPASGWLLSSPITMTDGVGEKYTRPHQAVLIETMFKRANTTILNLEPIDPLHEAASLTSRRD